MTTIREARIQTVCLLILSAFAAGGALYLLRPVLIPFVLALFFTFSLTPLIDFQMRYLRVPRSLAILITVLIGCAVLFLLSLLIAASVNQMASNVGEYTGQIKQLLGRIVDAIPLGRFGLHPGESAGTLFQISDKTVAAFLTNTFSAIMNIISRGVLVLIFMVFMLIGGRARERSSGGILSEVEYRVKRYLLTMIFVSGLTGILVGVTLYFLGVDFALMFGFLAFLLNFIPNIGSIIATLLPIPVVLLSPDLPVTAKILAIVIPSLIQFTIGNFIAPKMMGSSLDLHPVTVLLALMFFGMIWGIVGMFLATPITAVIRILCERMEITRPVAELLAGRLASL